MLHDASVCYNCVQRDGKRTLTHICLYSSGMGGGGAGHGGGCSGSEAFPVYFTLVFDFVSYVGVFLIQK